MRIFPEKKRIVHDRRVRLSFCPYCQTRLEMTRPERLQGDKHLAIGVCPKHGDFAVQLKVGKYTIKSGGTKFYVTKVLTHCTDEIRSLYTQKSEINREKSENIWNFAGRNLKRTAKNNLLIPVHL